MAVATITAPTSHVTDDLDSTGRSFGYIYLNLKSPEDDAASSTNAATEGANLIYVLLCENPDDARHALEAMNGSKLAASSTNAATEGANLIYVLVCENPDDARHALEAMNGSKLGSLFHEKPVYIAIAHRKEETQAQFVLKHARFMAELAGQGSFIPGGYPGLYYPVTGVGPQVAARPSMMYRPLRARPGWGGNKYGIPSVHALSGGYPGLYYPVTGVGPQVAARPSMMYQPLRVRPAWGARALNATPWMLCTSRKQTGGALGAFWELIKDWNIKKEYAIAGLLVGYLFKDTLKNFSNEFITGVQRGDYKVGDEIEFEGNKGLIVEKKHFETKVVLEKGLGCHMVAVPNSQLKDVLNKSLWERYKRADGYKFDLKIWLAGKLGEEEGRKEKAAQLEHLQKKLNE